MHIERLQIQGFGRIRDRDIRLSAPITVLAGPNEAGKSTILHFVRAMLYGIPSRSYPGERFEPPGGGAHGGVLTARAEDGSAWTVSRFASREGGSASGRGERLSIVKTTAQGTAVHMTQDDLEKGLLGGLSRDMFKQLFAVTLTELQEIRTLQSEEMGSYLFHAGFGGGAGSSGPSGGCFRRWKGCTSRGDGFKKAQRCCNPSSGLSGRSRKAALISPNIWRRIRSCWKPERASEKRNKNGPGYPSGWYCFERRRTSGRNG
ncbi:hypothetical protein CM49_00442 [Paenibacillus sp. P1XP2]|nr:hypothetical protein CM49_00442 [Paenibacillus sp. P1XP2]